jgi:plasmid stabilization system protein ParE
VKPALISKKAQADLKRIREHIAKDNLEAADRVRNAILVIRVLHAAQEWTQHFR